MGRSDYYEQLEQTVKDRYNNKLKVIGGMDP